MTRKEMNYRREIDGLRAFAVVSVILFHAGFKAFGGGFVGVDVFFVISGYLISNIIFEEIELGQFSIFRFYERRARRILPALFLVMLVCLPFAWFWMLPSDIKQFSQSLVAVSIFASNILFWSESGYFDAAVELKPLLHTWSLAIEEQYYLIFPFLILFAWRWGRGFLYILLGMLLFLSLVIAQWGLSENPTATFYLLPARGWEFLIGAFVSFYLSRKNKSNSSQLMGECGGVAGLLLVLYAIFSFNDKTPFPGFYALVPTLGAALIIVFANSETIVGRLLSFNIIVQLGLVSYSAYLWHQPVFAFALRRGFLESGKLSFSILIVLTFILAYLSWRYVELPFRDKNKIGVRSVLRYGIICSMAFILLGVVGSLSNGFEARLSKEQRDLLSFNNYDYKEIYREGRCFLKPEQTYTAYSKECSEVSINGEEILIWGDSHAAALSFGLRGHFASVIQYTASGCPPLLDWGFVWRPMCKEVNN
jgi:peptidoglycan/LPS O-acetylase OafA/YrhL